MSEQKQCYKRPWFEDLSDVERALKTIKIIFGDNPWHEHQKIVGYLEGYKDGANFAIRQIENKEVDK